MKKRYLPILIIFALFLSACAAPQAAEAPPTMEPGALETAKANNNEAIIPVTGDGPITLKIVPGESSVSYEVGETFINQNNRFQLAVGVTTNISGEIYANPANPPESELGTISVNISEFKSDSSRRDGAIRMQWLESAAYPIATFTPTEINVLPESYTPGEPYSFTITGDLTVREVSQPVQFDVVAAYTDGTLQGSAQSTILMSDFGVGPISILGILNTEDEVKLTFNFVARP